MPKKQKKPGGRQATGRVQEFQYYAYASQGHGLKRSNHHNITYHTISYVEYPAGGDRDRYFHLVRSRPMDLRQ
jgi:hypothetical protein